jgi:hypothetical protein
MGKIKGMQDYPAKTSVNGWEALNNATSMVNNMLPGSVRIMISLAPGNKIEGNFDVIIHYGDVDSLMLLMFHWGAFIVKDRPKDYINSYKQFHPSGFR